MLKTNTHTNTVSHHQLKWLKSQFYKLTLLKSYSILFNPARSAINCDDYEEGDVMISIVVNFNAQNSKISKNNLHSKWNIQII